MRHFYTIIMCLVIFSVYGQQNQAVFQPGYNPTVPHLIGMHHKAVSHNHQSSPPTIDDFNLKKTREEINVYMVYEKDSLIGTAPGNQELFNPPFKLMDFYIIYDYNFMVWLASGDRVNETIPRIDLSSGGYLNEITVVNYFLDEKGKLREKKIRRSESAPKAKGGFLTFTLDGGHIADNSYIELRVQVKSRIFNRIIPSVSDLEVTEKSLTISYPDIFRYKMPQSSEYEIISTTKAPFELLHFRRDPGPANGHIDKFNVDANIFTFSLPQKGSTVLEFNLERMQFPLQYDIGIMPIDLIKSL